MPKFTEQMPKFSRKTPKFTSEMPKFSFPVEILIAFIAERKFFKLFPEPAGLFHYNDECRERTIEILKKGRTLLIVKPRDFTKKLLATEALDRRLPEHHPSKRRVSRKARNLRKGYEGEKSLDFVLQFLETDAYRIFHNLRIKDEHGFFQIDTLLLSSALCLILEVKDVYGDIIFDEMDQTIRKTRDGEEGFRNPIQQVQLQQMRLGRWLQKYGYSPFPIESLVVYSSPSTIIRNITNNSIIANKVIHKESLLPRINDFTFVYSNYKLNEDQLKSLSDALVAAHTPESADVLTQYDVLREEILPGVICPLCQVLPMMRIYGKWKCEHCGCKSHTAHLEALRDYQMLIHPVINNRQARYFLQLDSIYVAQNLLKGAPFQRIGDTSGRKYLLQFAESVQ